ncbi:MAG TPA: hypothetical protein PLM79_10250 [Syntrophobacteraceae bacterium]|nr:hypothetical protein [Syntrophobacteraceae bacterium]
MWQLRDPFIVSGFELRALNGSASQLEGSTVKKKHRHGNPRFPSFKTRTKVLGIESPQAVGFSPVHVRNQRRFFPNVTRLPEKYTKVFAVPVPEACVMPSRVNPPGRFDP